MGPNKHWYHITHAIRYITETRPGLVVLYDIRPGNEAGQFLQPRSPHGASNRWKTVTVTQHLCNKSNSQIWTWCSIFDWKYRSVDRNFLRICCEKTLEYQRKNRQSFTSCRKPRPRWMGRHDDIRFWVKVEYLLQYFGDNLQRRSPHRIMCGGMCISVFEADT